MWKEELDPTGRQQVVNRAGRKFRNLGEGEGEEEGTSTSQESEIILEDG